MVKSFFTKEEERQIVEMIHSSERKTSGEICVHLGRKSKKEIMLRARQVFKKLGLHRTRERNAILFFIVPESREFAILGDEGIHAKVKEDFWNGTRDLMTAHFKQNKMKEGILAGIESVGDRLAFYFPATSGDINELSNEITHSKLWKIKIFFKGMAVSAGSFYLPVIVLEFIYLSFGIQENRVAYLSTSAFSVLFSLLFFFRGSSPQKERPSPMAALLGIWIGGPISFIAGTYFGYLGGLLLLTLFYPVVSIYRWIQRKPLNTKSPTQHGRK